MSANPVTFLARVAESTKSRLNPAAAAGTSKLTLQIVGSNNSNIANKQLVINIPLQDLSDPNIADQYPMDALLQITMAPYTPPASITAAAAPS